MYGYFREKLHVYHFWELKAPYKCYLEDFPPHTGEFSLREIYTRHIGHRSFNVKSKARMYKYKDVHATCE